MKRQPILACVAMLLFVLNAVPASSQGHTAALRGVITRSHEPAPNLQVVMTSVYTGGQYKTKTDQKGWYFVPGILPDTYRVEVLGPAGDVLYTREALRFASNNTEDVDIDLDKPEASRGVAGSPGGAAVSGGKKLTKEEIAKVKADNEKLMGLNSLITQAQTAMQAQNWKEAETALQQLITAAPNTTRWEFFKALGDVQGRSGKYQDSIQTYEKAIPLAQMYASGKVPVDPKNPFSDPARAKAGIGQMMVSEGNDYFSLENQVKAASLYAQAAEISPNPSLVYYNLCSAELNIHETTAALAACDKSIAADPSKADPYYLKGKVLYGNGKLEKGKFVAPSGTAETLSKYLELAPSGEHTVEVKAMLQQMGKTP